jgi:hypothetical protein
MWNNYNNQQTPAAGGTPPSYVLALILFDQSNEEDMHQIPEL